MYIEKQMNQGNIFPSLRLRTQRSRVLDRICSIPYTIISLYTFLEDTKYLEPGCTTLRKMVPLNGSISQSFDAIYNRQTKFRLQLTEHTSKDQVGRGIKAHSTGIER